MTFQEISAEVLRRLGLDETVTDPFYTAAVLENAVNNAHRQLAREALLYRKPLCLDIPAGEHGRSGVPIPFDFIRFATRPRWNNGGTWQVLSEYAETELLRGGPLENTTNGTPGGFYLRQADGSDATVSLYAELVPGLTAALEGGFHADIWNYPAWVTTGAFDSQMPGFTPALHEHLVPLVCQQLAERTMARTGQAGSIAYWATESREAVLTVRTALERSRRVGSPRIRYV